MALGIKPGVVPPGFPGERARERSDDNAAEESGEYDNVGNPCNPKA